MLRLPFLIAVVGVLLIIAGVAMWSIPAAFIIAGSALTAVGVLYRYEEN